MATSEFERVVKRIDGYRDWMVAIQGELTAAKALGPDNGGGGEGPKAALIQRILGEVGVTEVEVIAAPDERVAGGRPNVVARVPGKDRSRTMWVMSHLDVVPAGDLEHWDSDPWTVRDDGDRLYGRGVEDNQQGMVASLALAKALHDEGVEPPIDFALLFVADEETGNALGIEYLLDHHDIFAKDDLILVPDGGTSDGSGIEVAEKGIGWIKCAVRGKAAHGSLPDKGVNAHVAAAHMIVALEQLHERFDRRDEVFDPPISTFPVTKVDANVPNVNTIPGEHTFYVDCRVIPAYTLDEVMEAVREVVGSIDTERGTKTSCEFVQRMNPAPPTPPDAPVVQATSRAVKAVYQVEGRPMGVGGGTVAACIRRKGYPAVVWATMDETMHGPNEYCIVANLIGDAKVFAHVLLA